MSSIEKLVNANIESFTQLYGEKGVDYMLNTAKMGKRLRFGLDPHEVNERYFAAERNLYNLNGHFGPGVFYEQQVQIATAVVDDLQKKALPSNNRFGVLVELNVGHTVPSKRLERVAGIKVDKRKVSDDLRWQSLVDTTLTHAASLISSHRINTGLTNVVAELHDWLATRLYSGDEGETHLLRYNTFHDPETNKAIDFGKLDDIAPPPLITRSHSTRVRHLKGTKKDFVYTDPRVKGISGVEKLVDRALSGDGVFRPEDVRDKGGIMYVAIGDVVVRDSLMERVIALLDAHPLKAGEITEEHEVDDDHGQSRELDLKRIKFPIAVGGVEPIELIFKDLLNHRNQEDEIGFIDPETGVLTGQGHEPYEQRRARRLLKAIYPKFAYRDFDVDGAILEGSREIAGAMRGRGLVESVRNGDSRRVLDVVTAYLS